MEQTVYQKPGRFVNVGKTERFISAIGGGVLFGVALTKTKSLKIPLILASAYLLGRGLTGRCTLYRWMNINRSDQDAGIQVERAITIQRPVDEIYNFWRRLENLPMFMRHLQVVEEISPQRSHWVAAAPLGNTVEWDSEIIHDVVNQEIRWRSLPGSQIENSGVVRFNPAPSGQGTELYVQLIYRPPGGSAGSALAKLLGEEPDVQIREDLRRLKAILETGEALTTAGQSSGRARIPA